MPTRYTAVVDVTTPRKAIWLVYDYSPVNSIGGRESVELEVPNMGFEGVKADFDIAQLLPSLTDWNDKLTVLIMEDAINKTATIAKAKVTPALSQDIKKILEVGWTGPAPAPAPMPSPA